MTFAEPVDDAIGRRVLEIGLPTLARGTYVCGGPPMHHPDVVEK